MLSNFLKQSWLVMLASLVFGLLVAGVHGRLKPLIDENAVKKRETQMRLLLPQADEFPEAKATYQNAEGNEVTRYYYRALSSSGELVGYALQVSGGGFADKVTLLVALDADMATLRGIAVLKSNETPGFGDKIKTDDFRARFRGVPADGGLIVVKGGTVGSGDEHEIMGITGATISSDAVKDIVNRGAAEMRRALRRN